MPAASFTTAGGVAASRIAKWNGSAWSALGAGVDNTVLALAVYDDGGGPALYAGGAFTTAGGVAASRIAKWNGSAWSALGAGVDREVRALHAWDDGSGSALYVGGIQIVVDDIATGLIAKWKGGAWSALGSGLAGPVQSLVSFDDGSGPALYAGGSFSFDGGMSVSRGRQMERQRLVGARARQQRLRSKVSGSSTKARALRCTPAGSLALTGLAHLRPGRQLDRLFLAAGGCQPHRRLAFGLRGGAGELRRRYERAAGCARQLRLPGERRRRP